MRLFKASIFAFLLVANRTQFADKKPSPDRLQLFEEMVKIPSGTFAMGCKDCGLIDALPVHQVELSAFLMDKTPVTNAQFSVFVVERNYKTVAEQQPDPKNYPEVPAKYVVPGSAVFKPPKSIQSLDNPLEWWSYEPGASWRHPEGKNSNISKRALHPVVHISYFDAKAYCDWANKRLPTEAEFEYAARGGLEGKRYAWGDELKPDGKWPANIWQGTFPTQNTGSDGHKGTSPVQSYPPNGYGLYDMGGNVWQWTSDWYRPDTYAINSEKGKIYNPKGPESSFDPMEPNLQKRVQRGGSFLCSNQYCTRYLVGSRGKGAEDSGASNVGFRCAKTL